MALKVLITGGAGYLGSKLATRLAARTDLEVMALDVRDVPADKRVATIAYRQADVRNPETTDAIVDFAPDIVVHLAAIVSPSPAKSSRLFTPAVWRAQQAFEYSVDVGGTQNVLEACVAAQVRRIVVTSSGAAYGYYADNPQWLTEECPVRGNEVFPYAHHKRLVEEMLAAYRANQPQLEQIVFRVGTIIGNGTDNQITNLFRKPRLIGVSGGDDRFVFIWDEDVATCLERAIDSPVTGIFNVAGDGALSMSELAHHMKKRYIRLPANLVRAALAIGKPLGLTRYGSEQVSFLQYRPVLDNRRLKAEFGFTPAKTSTEAFGVWWGGTLN